jgi:hypothetical protein
MMDQNRSILQKWERGHYPCEAVGVAEKATKGIISNSSSLNNGSLASTHLHIPQPVHLYFPSNFTSQNS